MWVDDRWRSVTDGEATQRRASHGHVGAAQLGTCDEAGGAPVTPQHLKYAGANEAASERLRNVIRTRSGHRWTERIFSGAIAVVGAVASFGIWALP